MDEKIKQYYMAKEMQKRLYARRREEQENYENNIYEIEQEANDDTRLINEAAYRKKEEIRAEYAEKIKPATDADLAQINEVVYAVQKKFAYCEVNPKLESVEVYKYSNHDENGNYIRESRKICIEPIDVLVSDQFKQINVYIVEDKNKPKNKYALIVRGRTIFVSEKLNLPNLRYGSHIIGVHTNHHTNIEKTIKNAPDVESLKVWYDTHKKLVLADYLEAHAQSEREYVEALELFKNKEWQLLFLYHKKEYYERNYSHGTETEEYKEVLKNIERLKKEVTKWIKNWYMML